MKYIVRAFAALVIVIFVAGCGNGVDMTQFDRLSQRVSQLELVIEDLQAQIPSPEPTEEAKGAESPFDILWGKEQELREMTLEECREIDHYEFLGVGETNYSGQYRPRVLQSGAFFEYDCNSHDWGWWFERAEGRAVDAWTLIPPDSFYMSSDDGSIIESGLIPMTPGEYGVPVNSTHPHYWDAMTFEDVELGMTVCSHGYGGEYDLHVLDIVLDGWAVEGSDDIHFTPQIVTADSIDGGALFWSLEFLGLIPNDKGLWAETHLTEGPCNSMAL